MTVNYERMTPLNTWLRFRSEIEHIDGKKMMMKGQIYVVAAAEEGKGDSNNEIIYTTGKGLWIENTYLNTISSKPEMLQWQQQQKPHSKM